MVPNYKEFRVRNDAIVIRGVHDVATHTSAETRKLESKLDALVNLQFSARNDAIVIRGVHDVATDTSAETRKPECKLDALVKFVTQLATNQKPASVARQFSARNDAIVIRGLHDVATDTSAETGKQESKLDALVNLVTQLAGNQKLPMLQESTASVLPMTTIVVSVLLRSNLEWMSILRLMLQTPQFSARNDAIVIRGVHDVATDTSAKSGKPEAKLDALVNLVTQLAANQKPASVASVCGIRSSNDHHTSVCPSSQQSGVDEHHTSAETGKQENKLDALVNLVTQLTANQKPAFVARVCGIRSSNDHHSSVCPSSQQSGVDKHSEAYVANTYSRRPQQQNKALDREDGSQLLAQFNARNDAIVIRGVHDVATDTSAESGMPEGKLDALVNLVTPLAANQKPTSIVSVCGIHSSNDHHTSVCPSSQQSRVDEHLEAYAANTYRIPPQQQRQDT
ncbi:hypothetical protein Fmac_028546 [Flemingia macrophylla]|uniref:Uncharacterized protein n=1 Tax=Flemingia macrophylla TaxID=520843 RepID=A0ABD1L7U6_9FABA